ncbi:hypothetical protein GO988_08870 [Hymenobacter sp. HMF4947]|uniref:Uncharacterized protein n=1 Tax=Hymenobacter ginkgonis TaxID=2682976 RepID=A0A7K1TDF0_9BACT|nr:hypothetical protein [Hymenobacter ginkgonis]MVN76435.1 hypothetical protein [Hymenobacter ginkgonis]
MTQETKGDTPTRTHAGLPLPTWQAGFLAALATSGNISQAARAVGLSRGHVYRVRADNPGFASEWDEAVKVATDALEEEARKLATGYYRSYKFHQKTGAPLRFPEGHPQQGQPYYEVVVQPGVLHTLLKAYRPELFGDKLRLDTGSQLPRYDLTRLSPDELALLEQLTAKASPAPQP